MPSLAPRLKSLTRNAIALIPWLLSMYTLYWLDYGEIWNHHTPHRGKISVAILVIGMALSFLLHSHLSRRNRHDKR